MTIEPVAEKDATPLSKISTPGGQGTLVIVVLAV